MERDPELHWRRPSDGGRIALAAVARHQLGLVTRAQALASDVAAHPRRAGCGPRRLEPVRRGVYRVAGTPETWEQALLGGRASPADRTTYASFRVGSRRSTASKASLATGLEVTQFGTPAVATIEGVLIHESARRSGPGTSPDVGRIPVTSVARTLCDLTAVVRPWDRRASRRRGVATKDRAPRVRSRDVAEDLEGRGRLECTVMREILEHRRPGYDPGESEPERRIADLLVRAGLARADTPASGRRRREALPHRPLLSRRSRSRSSTTAGSSTAAVERSTTDRARGERPRRSSASSVLRFTSKSSDQAIVDTVRAALERASAS